MRRSSSKLKQRWRRRARISVEDMDDTIDYNENEMDKLIDELGDPEQM